MGRETTCHDENPSTKTFSKWDVCTHHPCCRLIRTSEESLRGEYRYFLERLLMMHSTELYSNTRHLPFRGFVHLRDM